MRPLIPWDEFLQTLRESGDEIDGGGSPIRYDMEGDDLDPGLFVEVLSDLERNGVERDNVVAVLSASRLLDLFNRVSWFDRVPEEAKNEDGLPFPEEAMVYGVRIRVAPEFPDDVMAMVEPWNVALNGRAGDRRRVGIVENLSDPEIPEAFRATVEDVRADLFSGREPGGSTGENTTPAGDIDRKGEAFVPDPENEEGES